MRSDAPWTSPPRMPAPANTTEKQPGRWVSSGLRIYFRSPPEFAQQYDQCFVEQTALGKVFQQGRKGRVEGGEQPLLVLHEILLVSVPVIGDDRLIIASPIDCHQPYARFHQPPGQQASLSERRHSIAVAKSRALAAQIKRPARFGGTDQSESFVLKFIGSLQRVVPFQLGSQAVQVAQQ